MTTVNVYQAKTQLSKPLERANVAQALANSGVRELAVTWQHAQASSAVTIPHRDPFDVVLVAQARDEGLKLVTADRAILAAGLPFVADARE